MTSMSQKHVNAEFIKAYLNFKYFKCLKLKIIKFLIAIR